MPRTRRLSAACNSPSLSDILEAPPQLPRPTRIPEGRFDWAASMFLPPTRFHSCSAVQSVVIDDCHPWDPNFNESDHLNCCRHNHQYHHHNPSFDDQPTTRPQQPDKSLACRCYTLPFPITSPARLPQHSDVAHRHQPEGAFVTRPSWSPLPPRCLPKLTPTVASNAPGCLTLS